MSCSMKYNYLENWKAERKLWALSKKTRLSVIDSESLTKRLCKIKENDFQVDVQSQQITLSKNSMVKNHKKISSSLGLLRCVNLVTNSLETIQAKSFFPIRFLEGKERFIKILGNRSLGSRVLSSKRFYKSDIIYIIDDSYIHRFITYSYKCKKIYVDEIFPRDFVLHGLDLFQVRRKVR